MSGLRAALKERAVAISLAGGITAMLACAPVSALEWQTASDGGRVLAYAEDGLDTSITLTCLSKKPSLTFAVSKAGIIPAVGNAGKVSLIVAYDYNDGPHPPDVVVVTPVDGGDKFLYSTSGATVERLLKNLTSPKGVEAEIYINPDTSPDANYFEMTYSLQLMPAEAAASVKPVREACKGKN